MRIARSQRPGPALNRPIFFKEAFHNSPALSAVIRFSDNRIVEVNESFLRGLGFRREDVLGKTPQNLKFWFRPEQVPQFRDLMEKHGHVRNYEMEVRRTDGSVRTVLLSSQLILIDGEPHAVSSGVDITEQKRIEAELQLALGQARELSQLKSDFVSLVSHEFRTPLEVIMSSADNLERYHERLTPEKRAQLLQTINKSVRRMSYMMEDVLLMGRIESGRIEFNPVTFDLESFCRRLCDEMETARNRRCPIQLTVEGDLTRAHGDETVLRHILTNLISNAVKYSEAGKSVDLKVSRRGKDAFFHVVDRGCGIPVADQARLFQAFHRGSNVRQLPGTGLGFVIVQRSVLLHGVIEDEPATLENLVLMLEMEGFKPFSAPNGRAGVAAAKRELPDVILCDVSMPERDGYGVLESLRADSATVSIPFIFLTAKGDKKDLRTGMNLGADDYLTKPASAEDVLAAINTRLQRQQQNARATLQNIELKPNFDSAKPLESLGITPREAEVLLWIAQGKSNADISTILGCAENTVKVHIARIFEKLGIENRNAASLKAIEVLSKYAGPK